MAPLKQVAAAEWQPVPEIVRLNFQSLHDVMKAHGDKLRSLEKSVAGRVAKLELDAALQDKVGVGELTSSVEDLSRILDDKADARDTLSALSSLASRTELQGALSSHASEVQRRLDAKASMQEVKEVLVSLEARLGAAEAQLAEMIARPPPRPPPSAAEMRAEMQAMVAEAVGALREELRDDVARGLEAKPSTQSVASALRTKLDRDDVDGILDAQIPAIEAMLKREATNVRTELEDVSSTFAARLERSATKIARLGWVQTTVVIVVPQPGAQLITRDLLAGVPESRRAVDRTVHECCMPAPCTVQGPLAHESTPYFEPLRLDSRGLPGRRVHPLRAAHRMQLERRRAGRPHRSRGYGQSGEPTKLTLGLPLHAARRPLPITPFTAP